VGSYEDLEGGFWTDAIQSFTGGVVERIKIRDKDGNVPDNLFDIMLALYSKGSSLCCIKKVYLCHTAKVILGPLYGIISKKLETNFIL
jgi:hypothetical protein